MGLLTSPVMARLRVAASRFREVRALNAVPRRECHVDALRRRAELPLADIFRSRELEALWNESRQRLEAFRVPDGTGGVNPGDRRAIFHLVSHLGPASVLEVGTFIGASTIHFAAALHATRVRHGEPASLTSVDLVDVNAEAERPWMKHGGEKSPREMIRELGYGGFVEFVKSASVDYLAACDRKFDFIFLDGDHSAPVVYQEIPRTLGLLNRNGVILLHDFFPEMTPLWPSRPVIAGPFLAVRRLLKEGANLAVVPLGSLPWPTKLGSNLTSLAVLLRGD